MTETTASLLHKIHSADDLQAVVSAMKAIAMTSIGQYQDSVRAQHDYYHAVLLGLLICLQRTPVKKSPEITPRAKAEVAVLVFGSDQGLVGQFNETLADFVAERLATLSGTKRIWAIGERIQARLEENRQPLVGSFALPTAIGAVRPLVTNILTVLETQYEAGQISEVYIFHNRPTDIGIFEPNYSRLLPLDDNWRANILRMTWPGKNLPEALNHPGSTLLSFVHEYLFVTLFRACAESLASENASRLVAMQRAEKNIDELLERMHLQFHQLRQSGIDEELFDLVSSAEAARPR